MELSILIVNWNSKDYLYGCIASILCETKDIEFEIIVIDSGSFDGCGAMLKERYPQVQFIQSASNVGFARANNLAFATSTGDCLLFLNPDTELVGPAINVLHRALLTLPYAGVVGGKLLNADRTIQTSCVKAFPNLLNQFVEANLLQKCFPRSRLWGMQPLFQTPEVPAEADVVSGACMAMRRAVFHQIGGFSTDYFIYSEDVELCLRTKRAGLKNYYIPSAVILHHGGCTSDKTTNTFSPVMELESRWRFFLNTRSRLYGYTYRIGIGSISLIRIGLMLVLFAFDILGGKSTKRCRPSLEKWWARLRWTLGAENWVKDY